jgi:hypothetical protein
MARLAFRLIAAVVAIPIGRAVTKGTRKAWLAARPDDPVKDPKKLETRWQDALVWAGLTGFGTAVAQLASTKGADVVWRAITGTPSPPPKVKKSKKDKAKQDVPAAPQTRVTPD